MNLEIIPSAKSGRNKMNKKMKILAISLPILMSSVFLFSYSVFGAINEESNNKSNVALSSVGKNDYATGNHSILGLLETANGESLITGSENSKANTEIVFAVADNKEVKQISVAEGVKDTSAPVINLKQQEVKIKAGSAINLKDNVASVVDNLDGNIANYTVAGNVNRNRAGSYTITVKAADSSNNVNTVTYKVTVEGRADNQGTAANNNEATSNAAATVDTSSVVAAAKSLTGTRYRSGGTSPSGFDCSGFVQYSFKAAGKNISRSSAGQMSNGKAVSEGNLQPGDIILWANNGSNRVSHSSIYVGNNSIIHATSNKGVRTTSVSAWKNWGQHIVGIRRV